MASELALDESYLRDPDVQLMLQVKEGDEAAYSQLVMKYQDRLVGLLHHIVNNQETAEDLAQEVFLRVYRARKGYVPTAKFSTWMFRIAHNLAFNSRRNKGRRKEVALNPRESGPMGARPEEQIIQEKSGLMPNRQFDQQELRAVVRDAMTELGDRQQMALLLHKFEEMSYADIATTLEMSVQAVKSLLARARENLRLRLEPFVKAKK